MCKTRTISVLLMTLFWGSGDFFKMERGFVPGHSNVSKCQMPKPCDVTGFTSWFKVGHYCVKYFNKPSNFTDAELNCVNLVPGGHLVSVHSEEENDNLLSIVKKFKPKDLRFWLGGFRLLRTDRFLWLDGSFWNYNFWAPNEPNHIYTKEECVEMNFKYEAKWNDESCFKEKNYMCAFKRVASVE